MAADLDPAVGEVHVVPQDLGRVFLNLVDNACHALQQRQTKGEPGYAGGEECEDCHKKAVDFWKTTVHAKAWTELVDVNKQWSYDCISCHVTGYGRPGGSSMAHVSDGGRDLTAVQCEVCHGPGSQHNEAPKKVHLRNPVEADCKDCHTKEHSDTFQYEAYLRDILGPGHGEKKRAELGPGVTGHDLRHGAIERAKEKQ